MKYLLASILLFQSYLVANAHYSLLRLALDGNILEDFRYVRKPRSWQSAIYDFTDPDLRCGYGAENLTEGVETLTVHAGHTVGFMRLKSEATNDTLYSSIYHQGPFDAYMSRAPNDDIMSYEGDGDWFKIGEYGPKNATRWICDSDYEICSALNFTIPKTTPPGKYLLRSNQLYMISYGLDGGGKSMVQMFVSCAHINVVGSGGGTPGPMTKIPGIYSIDQPQINVPKKWSHLMSYAGYPEYDISNYTFVGPPVWSG